MDMNSPKFIDIHKVCEMTSIGKTTLLQWEAQGIFPRAIRLSPHKRVWLASQVTEWMLAKVEISAGGLQ